MNLFILIALLAVAIPMSASAQCTMPHGAPDAEMGVIVFNKAHKVMQYCNGDDWVGLWGGSGGGSGGVPAGAVMSFDLTICPEGWSDYLPARGRFVRGIDNGVGIDPDGTRAPGHIQLATRVQQSSDVYFGGIGFAHPDGTYAETYYGSRHRAGSASPWGGPNSAVSVRPVNVSLLYCRKN